MNDGESLEENFKIGEILLKARECIDFLKSHEFLSPDSILEIEKRINLMEKQEYMFVSKPFIYYPSMGETAFYFMKTLQKNMKKLSFPEYENKET